MTVLPGGALIKDETLRLLEGRGFGSGSLGAQFLTDGKVQVSISPLPFPRVDFSASTFTPVSSLAVNFTGQAQFGMISKFEQHFSEVVPEPSNVWLLGSGLVALILWGARYSAAFDKKTRVRSAGSRADDMTCPVMK